MRVQPLMIALAAATLLAGCAHAAGSHGYSGKWVEVPGESMMLIIKNTGGGHYSVVSKRQTLAWGAKKVQWVMSGDFEFSRHGDALQGHVKQIPQTHLTLMHKGPGEILFTSPDTGLFGQHPKVFRRSH